MKIFIIVLFVLLSSCGGTSSNTDQPVLSSSSESSSHSSSSASYSSSSSISSISSVAPLYNATLNWIDNDAEVDGFKIYRSTDGNNFTQVVELSNNGVFEFVDAQLPANTYYWYVTAFNTVGESQPSDTVSKAY